ncbi:putative oxoacyl-(acyl carrier protein) reductase [Magnetospirillum gryphiswaldense MSR-1 v2]|uniref:Oxoacyl-(Acyl carrier protein) reductase n=1 Tax=Magnetospirillum gryphiswaldense (strain DSM 6361 / JCM 21280 / NBRC 15271 / MSR-1) TaxID=431944 RepID=V6EZX5_MAGGM|nr:SDR family NAD(P)-dependent oxidoreductase [Magnetospirillum gryphiswaldense]CDK98717.1 putative oxoacyl-(acyl carrier protein) reductase [Magnetospirillum gryphiswaldense MSR-1 v2]
MSNRLQGRVALVTGASRGIGRAVAKRFAAEGAEVICVARTQGALEELDDEIANAGGKAVLCPLNLREFDKIDQVAAALYQRFGRLDILVGNAGDIGGGLAPIGHVDQKHFQEAFDVNVTANYRLIRAFAPLLKASDHGRAVFVTSDVAQANMPYWGVYAAGKAALESIVLTWAAEIANISNIKANLIDPGAVATRMRTIAFPGEDAATLAQPDDVAGAFVDLAEVACQHHGQIIRLGR